LHMLMKSQSKMLTSRLVRELIFKGADKHLKNKDGKMAIDLVDSMNCADEIIRMEVKTILGEQPLYIPCFQVKAPLRKLEKNKLTMITYVVMSLLSLALLTFFVLPFTSGWQIPTFSAFGVANLFFLLAALKDPGYVAKSMKISFLKLNKYFEPSFICPTCEILRP